MSVLSIIQQHCRIHALNVPTAVIGSTDTQVNQLYGVLLETLDDMIQESKFNVTTQEAVFTVTAAEDQGAMATLAPNGYFQANIGTFYDRTNKLAMTPLSDTEWQAMKASGATGPSFQFRIRNDRLLLSPVPTAPLPQVAFEYMSSWCVKSAAGTLQSTILADDDTMVFPPMIVRKWLMYRWKLLKGLPYQEDMQAAYEQLNNYIARDKVKRPISLDDRSSSAVPSVMVPSGSWMH